MSEQASGAGLPRRALLCLAAALSLAACHTSLAGPDAKDPPPGQYKHAAEASTCTHPPQVAAWTAEAGPDDSVFLVSSGLPADARLRVQSASGRVRKVPTHWNDDRYLLAVLPADLPHGPLLAAAGRDGCWSAEFALNAPQAWWVYPENPAPGGTVRVFGRNLNLASALTLEAANGPTRYLKPMRSTAHWIETQLPADLPPGACRLRPVAAGLSTSLADAVAVEVAPPVHPAGRVISVTDESTLRRGLDELAKSGGELRLAAGHYSLDEALRIPPNVRLQGTGIGKTVLTFGKGIASTPGLVKPTTPYEESARLPIPLPGRKGLPAAAGVLMFGSGSALADLSIDGGGVLEQGIAIAGTRPAPVERIALQRVRIDRLAPFQSAHGRTEAVLARHVRGLELRDSVLMGQGPALFLEDVADSAVIGNRLAGGGEGIITGREGGVRRTIIEGNQLLSTQDGTVQAVRAIWLSTLFGSTYENYIASNSGANFHPPPGTNQNRGEAILLETALSHPYFGRPQKADSDSVTLPAQGPDWEALDRDSDLRGTPMTHYFAVILNGPGQGQARRVVARNGSTLRLDRAWRVVPDADSTVVLTELFYRNLIVDNEIRDAMTGIQLWVNGIDNIISSNRISETTAEGILLYSLAVGGPHTRAPFWPIRGSNMAGFNRGIGVSSFNLIEHNRICDVATGISTSASESRAKFGSIEWPTSLGNVVRNNVITGARGFGIWSGTRGGTTLKAPATARGFSIVGTTVEANQVSSATNAFGGDARAQALAFRRNAILLAHSEPRSMGTNTQGSDASAWIVGNNSVTSDTPPASACHVTPPPQATGEQGAFMR